MTDHSNSRFRSMSAFVAMAAILMLSGCAETQLASHLFKKATWAGSKENAGTYKVGNPYSVAGVRYHPREDFSHSETGIASWYGPNFHGKHTANGEVYDQNALTAAHRTLQMPSLVRVTNLENGKSVVVRINDRGPFKRGRVIDVSKKAATLLGFIGNGTARVRVDVLEKESRQIAEAARRGMDTSRMSLAELNKIEPVTAVAVAQQQRNDRTPVLVAANNAPQARYTTVATLRNDAEALPESLQTPTITVEELAAPGAQVSKGWGSTDTRQAKPETVAPPKAATRAEREQFVQQLALDNNSAGNTRTATEDMASGHLKDGRFMPDPVVTQQPVSPTGIFVQAGSFSVQDNAVRLGKKLESLGPVQVDPVAVSGRQFWRVRVGPISSVDRADAVLDEVIRIGGAGAKVIR